MTCVVFPLILKIKVKVEVAGYVENVHAIDEDHVEGHHGHQVEDGWAPARERIHAGSVEDKLKTANSCFISLLINEHWKKNVVIGFEESLQIELTCNIKDANDDSKRKEWEGEAVPLQDSLNVLLETAADIDEPDIYNYYLLTLQLALMTTSSDS